MKEISRMICETALEYTTIQMEIIMKVNGKMIEELVVEEFLEKTAVE
jgi:hypothetical protein